MKARTLVSGSSSWLVVVAALGATACDDKPAGPAAASTTAAAAASATSEKNGGPAPASGVCGDYQAALETCLKGAPDGHASLKKTLDNHRRAWDAAGEVQRKQMETGCRMGLASLKQNPLCKTAAGGDASSDASGDAAADAKPDEN